MGTGTMIHTNLGGELVHHTTMFLGTEESRVYHRPQQLNVLDAGVSDQTVC